MRTEPLRAIPGRRRLLWRAAKLSAAVGLGFVALVAAAAAIFASCMSSFNIGGPGRQHLKPIPIAASACPDVRTLHNIANDVQRNEPVPLFDTDSPPDDISKWPLAWPSPSHARSQRFSEALQALDHEITVSNPHFPPAVRRYLTATQRAVRRGRLEIAHTYYGLLPNQPTTDLLGSGEEAFGFASDLVGAQCGVGLQADNSTMPDQPFIFVNSEPTPSGPAGPHR